MKPQYLNLDSPIIYYITLESKSQIINMEDPLIDNLLITKDNYSLIDSDNKYLLLSQ